MAFRRAHRCPADRSRGAAQHGGAAGSARTDIVRPFCTRANGTGRRVAREGLTSASTGLPAKEALMTTRLHTASVVQMLLIALVTVTPTFGQGGRGGRGMMGDSAHA